MDKQPENQTEQTPPNPEAPADASPTQPGQDVVAPAPAEQPAETPADDASPEDKKDDKKSAPKVQRPKSQRNSSTGVIIAAVVILIGLCALAVMAYLDSK